MPPDLGDVLYDYINCDWWDVTEALHAAGYTIVSNDELQRLRSAADDLSTALQLAYAFVVAADEGLRPQASWPTVQWARALLARRPPPQVATE